MVEPQTLHPLRPLLSPSWSAATQADVPSRLGAGPRGARDLLEHSWFRGIDWALVASKSYCPSYTPPVGTSDDTSNFDDYTHTPAMHHAWDLSSEQQRAFIGF